MSLALDVSSLLPSLQASLQSVQHLESRAAATEADAAALAIAKNARDALPGPSQQTPAQSLEARQTSSPFEHLRSHSTLLHMNQLEAVRCNAECTATFAVHLHS